MFFIHAYMLLLQLFLQAHSRHCVSEKERSRVLVIYKIAFIVLGGLPPSLFHRLCIRTVIFQDSDPRSAEQVFLPLFRIGRHMHHRVEPERRTDDADAQPQVPRGAHLYGPFTEKPFTSRIAQFGVWVLFGDQAIRDRQLLRIFEDLVYPPLWP